MTTRVESFSQNSENILRDGDHAITTEMQETGCFNPVKAEMALWAAVITQALMDAANESPKPEIRQEKAKAIRWLLGNSEDFMIVCMNAGYDPSYIREKTYAAMQRGYIWRQGMHARAIPPSTIAPLEKKQRNSPSSLSNGAVIHFKQQATFARKTPPLLQLSARSLAHRV